jgi:hypothetical protein
MGNERLRNAMAAKHVSKEAEAVRDLAKQLERTVALITA